MLLLDEPSNDLDVEAAARAGRSAAGIRGLRDGDLARSLVPRPYRHAHPGVRRRLACEFFTGNYQEYEGDKKRRLGEEGAKPKRIRYKPIARSVDRGIPPSQEGGSARHHPITPHQPHLVISEGAPKRFGGPQ